MSVRGRRLISAMTPEAKEKIARFEGEGRDLITGKKQCERVECGCAVGTTNHNSVNDDGESKDSSEVKI
jgi:hypothetical protein